MALSRSLEKLYKSINRDLLPDDLKNYNIRQPGESFDLKKDLAKLKYLLLQYKDADSHQETNTYLFLAIIGLYTGEYKLSLYFIRKLETINLNEEQLRLGMEIKYTIRELDEIVILTSAMDSIRLDSIHEFKEDVLEAKWRRRSRSQLKIEHVSEITSDTLKTYFETNEQVFLIGHGNTSGIKIGGKIIDQNDIISLLKGVLNKPNVLGIFSCGNAFNIPGIWDHVDYFMTDTFISAPIYSEMFLYGYISSYYRNRDVLKAFDAGWIVPTINAIDKLPIILKEKGIQIMP